MKITNVYGCTSQKGVWPRNRGVGPNRLRLNAKYSCCVRQGGAQSKQLCKQQNSELNALRPNQTFYRKRRKFSN